MAGMRGLQVPRVNGRREVRLFGAEPPTEVFFSSDFGVNVRWDPLTPDLPARRQVRGQRVEMCTGGVSGDGARTGTAATPAVIFVKIDEGRHSAD
jgi:hypothetical protein